jgi:hypothetical protein
MIDLLTRIPQHVRPLDSRSSPTSLLNYSSRCDATVVPGETCRGTERSFSVEIACLYLHTALLAFDRISYGIAAVPSARKQHAGLAISRLWHVSI